MYSISADGYDHDCLFVSMDSRGDVHVWVGDCVCVYVCARECVCARKRGMASRRSRAS